MTKLVFSRPTPENAKLVFGEDGGLVDLDAELQISAALTFTFAANLEVTPDPIANRVTSRTASPWHDGDRTDVDVRAPWAAKDPLSAETRVPWRDFVPFTGKARVPWRDGQRTAGHGAASWRQGEHLRGAVGSMPWRQGLQVRSALGPMPWHDGVPVWTHFSAPWRDAQALLRDWRLVWDEPTSIRRQWRGAWRGGRLSRWRNRLPWRDGLLLISHGGKRIEVVVPPPEPCYTPSGKLVFAAPWTGSARLVFVCKDDAPVPRATVVVPVRRVYMVLNNVTLRRVDGDIFLPALSLSMSLDADSWTWSFSASLPAAELANVQGDEPVELEASINGTAYRMLAERVARERAFGEATVRVSGRGKSALLDAPYAPQRSFGNVADRTAAQLLDDALTVNGVGIGWTVDFGLDDWLVPAGAWAHQGTHMSAVNAIAAAAGGYVQPHPALQVLQVLPRYPSAPWEWGTVTPDFELPSAVTLRESIEWVNKPVYDRVFISGQGTGVLGQITRAGTAGELIAPMVTDPLATAAEMVTQRGRAVLSDTGRQALVSLQLPVLAETGVIQPGKFVRYVDGGDVRLGIVRSTSVDAAGSEVWQSLGVETHV